MLGRTIAWNESLKASLRNYYGNDYDRIEADIASMSTSSTSSASSSSSSSSSILCGGHHHNNGQGLVRHGDTTKRRNTFYRYNNVCILISVIVLCLSSILCGTSNAFVVIPGGPVRVQDNMAYYYPQDCTSRKNQKFQMDFCLINQRRNRHSFQMVGNEFASSSSSSSSSSLVKEFALYEELEEIVQLASQPIPERPDGIVCVAKYTSASRQECQGTELDYDILARQNPATIFLRCFQEYENAVLVFGQANVQLLPTYDIFYGGNRVARIQGESSLQELQDVLNMYQFQNSNFDLFSEMAKQKWGEGTNIPNVNKTPRTTNRFIPGYDWNTKKGFFDEQGEKAQQSFEEMFGNWVPNIDNDDDDNNNGSNTKK